MVKGRVNITDEPKLRSLSLLAQPVKDLFYAGNFLELLDEPRVAIVGSRKVSPYGQAVTVQLATTLARAGVVIVSGLAIGIDSIAHKAALDAGGLTIAVLPAGLDKVYPASHYQLSRRIIQQGGALVTEYPAGSGSPQKWRFIARNRIIAGLSLGVVIPEAANKSGSLHTAEFALEQGIEVFAVPGNILSSLSAGTNNLIKIGAHPITSANDILEILGIKDSVSAYKPANELEEILLHILSNRQLTSDQLLSQSKMEPSIFNQTLTMLEINGAIQQSPGGDWSLI